MHEEYQHVQTIYSAGCDMQGWWKLSTVLDVMQTTADRHNELLKCSRADFKDRGVTWVLYKTVIQMHCYPKIGEHVAVCTYTKAPCMHFIPRYYEMTDINGKAIGRAGSLWVLLDVKTKKSVKPRNMNIILPKNSDAPPLVNLLNRPLEPEGGEKTVAEYQPVCCDIDINGHVNNTRYTDWLYNSLGISIIRKYAIESATIVYNYETLPTHTLQNCLVRDGNIFSYKGYESNIMNFSVTGVLKERSQMIGL